MKTTENTQQKSKEQNTQQSKGPSNASQAATEKAKKGEPLSADRPRDRSPKQENL
jgi:hypothetical protein